MSTEPIRVHVIHTIRKSRYRHFYTHFCCWSYNYFSNEKKIMLLAVVVAMVVNDGGGGPIPAMAEKGENSIQ